MFNVNAVVGRELWARVDKAKFASDLIHRIEKLPKQCYSPTFDVNKRKSNAAWRSYLNLLEEDMFPYDPFFVAYAFVGLFVADRDVFDEMARKLRLAEVEDGLLKVFVRKVYETRKEVGRELVAHLDRPDLLRVVAGR